MQEDRFLWPGVTEYNWIFFSPVYDIKNTKNKTGPTIDFKQLVVFLWFLSVIYIYIYIYIYKYNFYFNLFTAMLAAPSLGKRPIKAPKINLKSLRLFPLSYEQVKRFLSKRSTWKVDLSHRTITCTVCRPVCMHFSARKFYMSVVAAVKGLIKI